MASSRQLWTAVLTTAVVTVGTTLAVSKVVGDRNARLERSAGTSRSATSSSFLAGKRKGKGRSEDDDDEHDDDESDDDDEEGGSSGSVGKRYRETQERYSPMEGEWQQAAKSSSAKSDEKYLFVVKYRTWPKSSDYSGQMDVTHIVIKSKALLNVLRNEFKEAGDLYDEEPAIEHVELYHNLHKLRETMERIKKHKAALEDSKAGQDDDASGLDEAKALSKASGDATEDQNHDPSGSIEALDIQIEHLSVFLEFCDKLFAPIKTQLERLTSEGMITYKLLWALFPPSKAPVVKQDEVSAEKQAFEPWATEYLTTRQGNVFQFNGNQLIFTGSKFVHNAIDADIPQYSGTRKISSLPVRPMTEAERVELTERGKRYVELAGVHFLSYSGVLYQLVKSGLDRQIIKTRAEGRAIIDVRSYIRMCPSRPAVYDGWDTDSSCSDTFYFGPALRDEVVPEEELCLTPPTVYGFSLVSREWGEMLVTGFSPIKFRQNAYDHLVLDPDYKQLIRSLVEQNTAVTRARAIEAGAAKTRTPKENGEARPKVVTDVISGKGGGLVIVLHGRPGVGKTLTAEAVSELLRAPLYTVGAGELGVNAELLEKRLRDILDMCADWGAVLLIDEADVFLEQRSMHDVSRNAMVSVFLRLLEYHSGVLFLTTNRVKTLDEAFVSRFSIAVTYPDLDRKKRKVIWKSFLRMAGVGIEGEKKIVANGDVGIEQTEDEKVEITSTIPSAYLDKLAAKTTFNGRSIKNIVRTAQALALSANESLSNSHLDKVIKVSETFADAFKEMDEEGIYDAAGEGWKDRTNVYV